jgi:hypothetical protein
MLKATCKESFAVLAVADGLGLTVVFFFYLTNGGFVYLNIEWCHTIARPYLRDLHLEVMSKQGHTHTVSSFSFFPPLTTRIYNIVQ